MTALLEYVTALLEYFNSFQKKSSLAMTHLPIGTLLVCP